MREHERPNVDAFATPENAKLPFYATLEPVVHQFYDGLQTRWRTHHVLWCFPPIGVAEKALMWWNQSDSLLAYFCVPDLQKEDVEKLIAEDLWTRVAEEVRDRGRRRTRPRGKVDDDADHPSRKGRLHDVDELRERHEAGRRIMAQRRGRGLAGRS